MVDDPGGPFVRTFRINLGTKSGVVEGQAVMDEHGLVGRIVAAGKTASRVLLITDLNSRVPVMIEPTGVRGMLIGQNDAPPVVTYLPRDFNVQVGNVVVTSGHGGLLPPDIPVGTITAIKDDQVVIKPATNLNSVMYVRVLDYTSPMADVPYSTKGPPILNSGPPLASPTPTSPAAHNKSPASHGAVTAAIADAPAKKPPRVAKVPKPTEQAQGDEAPPAGDSAAPATGNTTPGTASAALPATPTAARDGGFE